MKTAYELAMERLGKSSPPVKLSDEQKKQLSEIDAKYAAKIAERELFIQGQVTKAVDKGEYEEVEQLQKQLTSERKALRAEQEEEKEKVRKGGA